MPTTTKRPSKRTGKGQAFFTLEFFDGAFSGPRLSFPYEGIPFDEAPVLTWDDYEPRGGTPLYDAVAAMIHRLDADVAEKPHGAHFGLVLDQSGSMHRYRQSVIDGVNEFVGALRYEKPTGNDGRVMVVIFTDGKENSSKAWSKARIQDLVREREEMGWVFTYMSADLSEAADVAATNLGVDTTRAGAVYSVNNDAQSVRGATRRSANLASTYMIGGVDAMRTYAGTLSDEITAEDGS